MILFLLYCLFQVFFVFSQSTQIVVHVGRQPVPRYLFFIFGNNIHGHQNIQRIVAPVPVTVTEYGITTIGETPREQQADMMERGILLALSQGVSDVCWYTIQNGDDPTNFEDNFGLLNQDGSWSPKADIFQTLTQKIETGTHVARIGGLPDGLWGVQISGVGKAFWGNGSICNVEVNNQVTWMLDSGR